LTQTEVIKKSDLNFQCIEEICSAIRRGESEVIQRNRPFVTISFAQSLDGSIALYPSAPVKLSNHSSQIFTHHLRAAHQAILIGIGTLLADDPLLNVRLIQGRNPQPIVVDSYLRFPLKAKLMRKNSVKPWIASTSILDKDKVEKIENLGGSVLHSSALSNGWVNLKDLLELLFDRGVRSIMVEGGARIITSFLRENLADQIVLTVAPLILGGFRGVSHMEEISAPFISSLQNIQYEKIQDNLIIWGNIKSNNS
jgi:3,4-dihydroxy 2-butanone 4-phosphate synthase/GTP cyclohydrolase II